MRMTNPLKLKLKVDTLTSELLFHFESGVMEHKGKTTKRISLSFSDSTEVLLTAERDLNQ